MSDVNRTDHERPCRIPDFQSVREEMEFWDTHDITDFLDELKPVQVHFSLNLSAGMTVRLAPADREALGRIDAEKEDR